MAPDKLDLKRFKDGDAEAFDIIYHAYSKKMFHFTLGLVKDRSISEDIVQEVFISLWEKREQLNLDLSFDNYIFTITYNSIRKYFRKRSIETRAFDYLLKNSPEVINTVEGGLIFNELFEMATAAIEKLPPKSKEVYKLSRQEGMKIKEIAARMNISPRTAEHHIAKALKFLKEEISQISLMSTLFFYLFL